jgi:hypothetical protein
MLYDTPMDFACGSERTCVKVRLGINCYQPLSTMPFKNSDYCITPCPDAHQKPLLERGARGVLCQEKGLVQHMALYVLKP